MHKVAEGMRHAIGDPLLNRRLWNRRCRSRIANVLSGRGRSLGFFRRSRLSRSPLSLDDRFGWGFRVFKRFLR
jgi:hypothetical protein